MPAPHNRPHPHWRTARAYALTAAVVHGLAVFPLSPSKLPAIAAAHDDTVRCTGTCGQLGHGVYDASIDRRRVLELFAAAPWATGYGIACGQASRCLVGVDLDCKHGVDGMRTFADLAWDRGFLIPPTVLVATPSGGVHLWFTAPPGTRIPNSVGLLGPGIDIRGGGGYLVGPGSRTHAGTYRTFSKLGNIAHLPLRLLELLTTARPDPPGGQPRWARGGQQADLDTLVQYVLDAGEGELNNRLYQAALWTFEDPRTQAEHASAELLTAAVAKGHPEPGARRTIASAHRRIRGQVQQ